MIDEPKSIPKLEIEAVAAYELEFYNSPPIRAYAPGRVNLIGEHTDYNDGFVLPIAISMVTVIVGGPSTGKTCNVKTLAKEFRDCNTVTFPPDLNPCVPDLTGPKWSHYVKGVVSQLKIVTVPFNAVIISSVPIGSGLSSSASLEVAVYTFLEALNPSIKISPSNKALACQEAEHIYANVPCGIMDQFTSVMAREHHCLQIDCRVMSSELVPFRNPTIRIFIANSGVRHDLAAGEYRIRKEQCLSVEKIIGKKLRDCTLETLEESNSKLGGVLYRRAHHVITENARVLAMVNVLKQNDFITAGRLMIASHRSLQSDYEVSCRELDELVVIAVNTEGVYGSRMTGGGFGGCTVSLVKENAVVRLATAIHDKYSGVAVCYVCDAASGAKIIGGNL